MMSSMYTGISGMKTHQTKLDIISNNISNINTVAYKSGRPTFSDMFSRTVQSARGADGTGRAPTNPIQMGLGVKLASIDKNTKIGGAQFTGRPLDVMLMDKGYFIVGKDNGPEFLTRAGNFSLDGQGNLNVLGNVVYGWGTTLNAETQEYEVNENGDLYPIRIAGEMATIPPTSTTRIDLTGNIDIESREAVESSIKFYDSNGDEYTAQIVFSFNEEHSAWAYDLKQDEAGNRIAYKQGERVDLAFSPELGQNAQFSPLGYLAFNSGGILTTLGTGDNLLSPPENVPEGRIRANLYVSEAGTEEGTQSATFGSGGAITLDFTNLTQFFGISTATSEAADGSRQGDLKDMMISTNGTIVGSYSNGKTRNLWQIAVADIPNASGLEQKGGNLYALSANSGGSEGAAWNTKIGYIQSGSLEMSNTDLPYEITQIITAQRGFQANTKIITISDEMIQTASNLKR